MILAIDPGNTQSAYVLIDEITYKPIDFGILSNGDLLDDMKADFSQCNPPETVVIEMVASYGMAVGKTVFDTCVWIGRFTQQAYTQGSTVEYIYRHEEKINLCHTMQAKDSNIRQALIDRFGIVGTKRDKGFFYGFKRDIWAAYAVGVTYLDIQKGLYYAT